MGNLMAIIGGSGIKDSPLFEKVKWKSIDTGFSNGFGNGSVEYQENNGITFIPRHGNEIRYGPSKTQYGANLIAAKLLGAEVVIATSCVGSLARDIKPGDLVFPDDYVDETGRDDNLYGKGLVVHANPRPAFSEELRAIMIEEILKFRKQGSNLRYGDRATTYVCIPGDRFGTDAEGRKRRRYADIVGMTICPEASMAMQLGLHYAVVAFSVDSDFDARHVNTLRVMNELSQPDKVPAFISRVVEKVKKHDFPDKLYQLEGNIIPGNIKGISNPNLRKFAEGLVSKYCS